MVFRFDVDDFVLAFPSRAVVFFFVSMGAFSETASQADCGGSSACQAGGVLAVMAWFAGSWGIWIVGIAVFGILMLATRGKLVTYDVDG